MSFQSQFYGHPLNTDTVYFFPWGKKALAIFSIAPSGYYSLHFSHLRESQIFEEVADIRHIQAANCTAFNKIPVLIIKIQTWLRIIRMNDRMIGDRNDLESSDAKLLNNTLAS